MAAERTLRVGFVGAGRMGREHLRAFSDIPGVELAAITARTGERACALASEFKVQQCFSGLAGMIAAGGLDLLVVAVYETATVDVLTTCLEAGLPILTEKPVGLDLDHCAAVHQMAKQKHARLWVGLNRRCYSSTRLALADMGDEGPRLIEVKDAQDLDAARSYGWPDPIIRHWMFCNSIHLIDYFSVFGRGTVTGVEVLDHWTPGDPNLVLARIEFSSGDIGIYRAVWNRPGGWSCDVTTQTRRWEMRPLEQARVQLRNSRNFTEFAVAEEDMVFKAGFRFQAQDIVDAVRAGRPPRVVPDITQALETTRLVDAIYATGGDSSRSAESAFDKAMQQKV